MTRRLELRRPSRLNQRLAAIHNVAVKITNALALVLLALLAGVIISRV